MVKESPFKLQVDNDTPVHYIWMYNIQNVLFFVNGITYAILAGTLLHRPRLRFSASNYLKSKKQGVFPRKRHGVFVETPIKRGISLKSQVVGFAQKVKTRGVS